MELRVEMERCMCYANIACNRTEYEGYLLGAKAAGA